MRSYTERRLTGGQPEYDLLDNNRYAGSFLDINMLRKQISFMNWEDEQREKKRKIKAVNKLKERHGA